MAEAVVSGAAAAVPCIGTSEVAAAPSVEGAGAEAAEASGAAAEAVDVEATCSPVCQPTTQQHENGKMNGGGAGGTRTADAIARDAMPPPCICAVSSAGMRASATGRAAPVDCSLAWSSKSASLA